MAWCKFTIILACIALAYAAEENQATQFHRPPSSAISGTTTGFTVGKQYNLDAKVLKDGTTSGSLYAMLGGQVGPGPNFYNGPDGTVAAIRDTSNVNNSPTAFYYDAVSGQYYPAGALSQASSSSVWSPSNVNYYVAGGVLLAVVLGYGLYAFFTTPHHLLKSVGTELAADDDDSLADVAVPAKKDTKVASKKTRRRREIRRNEEAARLASIVLSAIESGECLEKSICLMGSGIGGTEKGKLAGTVLNKLVPSSVQDNHYFKTLQKALTFGQNACKNIRCKY